MALPRVYRVVQDSLGNVVPQVLCSVLNEGTGVLATLWQDDAATIPLSNPMTSDATYGSFGFYVEPGHYDLTFTKPGYTFQPQLDMQVPQDDLTLGTMAQQDASAVAITGGAVTGTTAVATTGGIQAQERGGDGQIAFHSLLNAAGGANRWAFLHQGDAPSSLSGDLGLHRLPAAGYTLDIAFARANHYGIRFTPSDADTGPGEPIVLYNVSGGLIGSITTTASATAFNTSSDARLKHAITALTGALAVVAALRPVAFRWNSTDEVGHGFLAHELQQVLPEAVTGLPDAVNEDGSIKPQQVDHSRIIPWLTAALQETLAQVQALTARVQTLEEQLGL